MKSSSYYRPALEPTPWEAVVDRLASVQAMGIQRVTLAGRSPGELDGACLHDSPRLAIVLEGAVEYWACEGGERIPRTYTAGEAIFTVTNGWMKVGRRPRKRARAFSMVFRPEYLRVVQSRPDRFNRAHRGMEWWHHTSRPLTGSGADICRALTSLEEEGGDPEAALSLTTALLRRTAHFLHQPQEREGGKALSTWLAIREVIRENLAEPISRETVAAALRIHPNHVSRLARSEGGTRFLDYVMKERIAHAQALLANHPELTVEEVAHRSGFKSAGYFGRSFREQTGTTPGAFRASHDRH
ncbi:MAG: AraC family transcriptional regulator [Planctomycetota bacterium]|jgi:AraC-like DNA-binding protein